MNKFRLPQGNDYLSMRAADVTNTSLIERLRWCSRGSQSRLFARRRRRQDSTKFL